MKLPGILESFFQKKSGKTQVYLSLYLDTFHVAASFWLLDANGTAKILGSEFSDLPRDSWVERSAAVDRLLGVLEEKTGHTDVTKAILGLPPTYLTATGEIRIDVRHEIKNFTKELALEAIGFVPLQQAVIYKMKKEEGVPPSVILLGINDQNIAVGIYKIGELVGVRDIEKHEDVVGSVEQGLRSFTDLEVLPARMLIYGSKSDELEEIKSKLLKHQWTSKVNFLHFPKIETIALSLIIEAISLAGASELGASMDFSQEEQEESEPEETQTKEPRADDAGPGEESDEILESAEPVETLSANGEIEPGTHVAVADSTPSDSEPQSPEQVSEEVAEAQEVISEDFAVDESASQDANVVMVDAESLGFKKDVDVLERDIPVEVADEDETDEESEDEDETDEPRSGISGMNISGLFGRIPALFRGFSRNSLGLIGVIGVLVFGAVAFAAYWFVPRATLTILEIPKEIDSVQTITIDPSATTTDAQNFIVPGRKLEKSVSGENTIPVNGKKSIGDPAKGSVTIYNKSLSSRSFKKGAVLSSGSLLFTIDSDVQVASASESIGSITFGKGDVPVTAAAIGAASNLPSGTEFTFKETSSAVAIARNDKAFSGGNSRDVTVVSRADYDAFVKLESEELVGKAKDELAKTVSSSQKLIDATTKTTVTEKVFSQEIDEEAKQLQGKLTVSISGIAYSDDDIKALLKSVSSDKIPAGYEVEEEKTTLTVTDVLVKKDGKITAKARMTAIALPRLDAEAIRRAVTGKSVDAAKEYLKSLSGIGAVSIGFQHALTRSQLPMNRNNISVIFSVFK